ncbi:hypothetical protein Trydic_g21137 [Trypoxylus dichotomus]
MSGRSDECKRDGEHPLSSVIRINVDPLNYSEDSEEWCSVTRLDLDSRAASLHSSPPYPLRHGQRNRPKRYGIGIGLTQRDTKRDAPSFCGLRHYISQFAD